MTPDMMRKEAFERLEAAEDKAGEEHDKKKKKEGEEDAMQQPQPPTGMFRRMFHR